MTEKALQAGVDGCRRRQPRRPGKQASQKQLAYLWKLTRTGYLDIEKTIWRWWRISFAELTAREASWLIDEQLHMTRLANNDDNRPATAARGENDG